MISGAGISTAASIPDFRGAEGLARNPKPLVVIGVQESDMDMKVPTYAHLVLADLTRRGHIKCVVTSNHDDLHGKAGTPRDKLVDLFGNCYVERCGRCKKLWQRHSIVPKYELRIIILLRKVSCMRQNSYYYISVTVLAEFVMILLVVVVLLKQVIEHRYRSLLSSNLWHFLFFLGTRFGAPTPAEPLRIAIEQSNAADVALVMGSSLTVSPFCELPTMAKNGYIVCNLQVKKPYFYQVKKKSDLRFRFSLRILRMIHMRSWAFTLDAMWSLAHWRKSLTFNWQSFLFPNHFVYLALKTEERLRCVIVTLPSIRPVSNLRDYFSEMRPTKSKWLQIRIMFSSLSLRTLLT